MARPERFELPTARFVAEYSIQLSYGRIVCCSRLKPLLHRIGGGEGGIDSGLPAPRPTGALVSLVRPNLLLQICRTLLSIFEGSNAISLLLFLALKEGQKQ